MIICSGRLLLIVNLIESRVTVEMGLSEYLLGIILITLVEMGSSAHCGFHHTLAGILDSIDKQREGNINIAPWSLLFGLERKGVGSLQLSLP